MSMKLCSIASGSSGNCIFVGSDATKLLVDTGISKKRIEEGLYTLSVDPQELGGILITHEHADHIKGLGVMSRRYKLPIYATAGTIDAIRSMDGLGVIDDDLFVPVAEDCPFRIGDVRVTPFGISHDAAQPVAYRFSGEGRSMAVVTDLGEYDEGTVDRLQKLDALLLESNHDVRMLQVGNYPYYLKRRILGSRGHLSNETCARLLCELIHAGMKHVLLGHLSQENNLEALALETVRQEAERYCEDRRMETPQIEVAHRDRLSGLVSL